MLSGQKQIVWFFCEDVNNLPMDILMTYSIFCCFFYSCQIIYPSKSFTDERQMEIGKCVKNKFINNDM